VSNVRASVVRLLVEFDYLGCDLEYSADSGDDGVTAANSADRIISLSPRSPTGDEGRGKKKKKEVAPHAYAGSPAAIDPEEAVDYREISPSIARS